MPNTDLPTTGPNQALPLEKNRPVDRTLRFAGMLAIAALCAFSSPAAAEEVMTDKNRIAAIGSADPHLSGLAAIEEVSAQDVPAQGAMAQKVRDDVDFQRAARVYAWARSIIIGAAPGPAPSGLAYWERLHAVIQRSPLPEREQVVLTALKPLGIEKGKPFQPDDRQKRLLTLGAAMGEIKARAQ